MNKRTLNLIANVRLDSKKNIQQHKDSAILSYIAKYLQDIKNKKVNGEEIINIDSDFIAYCSLIYKLININIEDIKKLSTNFLNDEESNKFKEFLHLLSNKSDGIHKDIDSLTKISKSNKIKETISNHISTSNGLFWALTNIFRYGNKNNSLNKSVKLIEDFLKKYNIKYSTTTNQFVNATTNMKEYHKVAIDEVIKLLTDVFNDVAKNKLIYEQQIILLNIFQEIKNTNILDTILNDNSNQNLDNDYNKIKDKTDNLILL